MIFRTVVGIILYNCLTNNNKIEYCSVFTRQRSHCCHCIFFEFDKYHKYLCFIYFIYLYKAILTYSKKFNIINNKIQQI